MIKKVILFLLAIFIFVILSSCNESDIKYSNDIKNEDNETDSPINIQEEENSAQNNLIDGPSETNLINGFSIENITKIKVLKTPPFDEIEIIDTTDIENIINYLNSINPFDTEKNAERYVGGGYYIEILYDDNTQSNISLGGNMFITIDDNPAQELPYREASYFDVVIGEIILKQYRAKNTEKENIVIGEIISVASERNEGNVSCEVKTDDNKIIEINVRNSKIIDITGDGRLVLLKKDKVEIILADTQSLIADVLFITKNSG